MTVLVVTPGPLASTGGVARLAQGLAASLARDSGLQVVVAAGSGAPGTPPVPTTSAPIREVRLPLLFRPEASRRGRWAIFTDTYLEGLEAVAHEVRPQAIIYVAHYSSCADQTAALADRLDVPLVLVPAIHMDHPQHTNRRAKRCYRSAALVLCLSEVERQWVVAGAGLPSHRVLTCAYGWNGPALRREPPRGQPQPLRLLTVGAYARHKRLDHQVEAVALLRRRFGVDTRLHVVGAVREPAVLERLRRLARHRGIQDEVRFLPDCPDSTVHGLHAASDLFLFTSTSESFGVALLEAIGRGTLPVVYPHPVYRGLVEGSGFGLVAKRSTPGALAETVVGALAARTGDLEEARLRWLAQRTWRHVTAPLSRWLSRFAGP